MGVQSIGCTLFYNRLGLSETVISLIARLRRLFSALKKRSGDARVIFGDTADAGGRFLWTGWLGPPFPQLRGKARVHGRSLHGNRGQRGLDGMFWRSGVFVRDCDRALSVPTCHLLSVRTGWIAALLRVQFLLRVRGRDVFEVDDPRFRRKHRDFDAVRNRLSCSKARAAHRGGD